MKKINQIKEIEKRLNKLMKEYDFDEMYRQLQQKCEEVSLSNFRLKCKSRSGFQIINWAMNRKLSNSFRETFRKFINCAKNVQIINSSL